MLFKILFWTDFLVYIPLRKDPSVEPELSWKARAPLGFGGRGGGEENEAKVYISLLFTLCLWIVVCIIWERNRGIKCMKEKPCKIQRKEESAQIELKLQHSLSFFFLNTTKTLYISYIRYNIWTLKRKIRQGLGHYIFFGLRPQELVT